MSPQQKYAAFNLAVAIFAMVAYFALMPFIGPWRATGAFGLLGLCGASAWVLYRANRAGRVVSDEREQHIWQRATLFAKSVVWAGLIAAYLFAHQTLGDNGQVSMRLLAFGIWWAFGVFLLVQSAVYLFLVAG
jgi:hypothetical protein